MVRDDCSFFILLGVKEEFKIRQNKTLLEGKRYKNTTLSYNEKIGGILQLLEGILKTSIGELHPRAFKKLSEW